MTTLEELQEACVNFLNIVKQEENKMNNHFETLAEKFNLDLTHNGLNYMNPETGKCHFFYAAHDVEIAKLKHDIANWECAARLLPELGKMK